jgi:hypothetical protein
MNGITMPPTERLIPTQNLRNFVQSQLKFTDRIVALALSVPLDVN